MRKSVPLFIVCFGILVQVATGQTDDAQCLETCLTDLQQKAPRLDAATVLSFGHLRTDNQTVVCPKYDAKVMNSTCGPFREATSCFAQCPDGPVKTLSTSGFAPLQFMCIDRQNEFERYMPCISENCASSESACQRKCGSFDDISKDIVQLLRQVRGTSWPDQNAGSRIDPSNITLIIDKACGSIRCYADCSRDSTVSKCGQEAYNLEIDTAWIIFTSLVQSMSSIGLSTPWPESCKTLAAASSNRTSNTAAVTEVPAVTRRESTLSNSVDQFIPKNRTWEQNSSASGNNTPTPKCQGAACGSAPEKTSSAFSVVLSVAAVIMALH